jgi:hypothetical protein
MRERLDFALDNQHPGVPQRAEGYVSHRLMPGVITPGYFQTCRDYAANLAKDEWPDY